MDACEALSFLNCELRIIRAKNLDFLLNSGSLFVRCYLKTGNNRRIRLNSREVPSTSDPYWNESVSLECCGAEDSMDKLRIQSVVFELRWRKATPVLLGIFGGSSKLLLREEIGWKDVLESGGLSIEKWVSSTTTTTRNYQDLMKPPALQIGMRVAVPGKLEMEKRRREVMLRKRNECCGCRNCECHGGDDDLFALAAALEAL